MIKRFRFARQSQPDFEARWLDLAGIVPEALRPLRAVMCTAVNVGDDPAHEAVGIEWFADVEALARHQACEREHGVLGADTLEPGSSIEVIAREVVLRGDAWLEQRWLTPAAKYKHMALARRAAGLTPAEFSERWRNRPGQIGGGQSPSLAIPEAAKGHAYCQNHPLPDSQTPAYDAINEVYFDQLQDMQPRLEFFRDHPVARLDADLVSEPRFLIVRERLVFSR